MHCADAFHRNHGENIFLWTPCGNTDIVVLAVGLFQEFNDWLFIVNGSGSNKEHNKLSDFQIDIESTSSLLGLHPFTVNDYVSRKEKKNVGSWWEKAETLNLRLENYEWGLTDELFSHLEEFECVHIVTKEKMKTKING